MSQSSNLPKQDNLAKMAARFLYPPHMVQLAKRGASSLKQNGVEATWRKVAFRIDIALKREVWQYRADMPLKSELKKQKRTIIKGMPQISVVVPLYNTPMPFFIEMVQSVCKQSYQNWQLVLADASEQSYQLRNQEWLKGKDKRICYFSLSENKGIAENTNEALKKARGQYIALFDHDDALQPNALFDMAQAISQTGAELLYSDEVVVDGSLNKLWEYHFKPDFGPDTLRGCNYITHLCVFSKALLERVGYFQKEYDGSQDYDLILRLSEQANKVHHIPKVLYFWRRHADSTASDIATAKPYALQAGQKALQHHLDRLGLQGTAYQIPKCPGAYRVQYQVQGNPLISVLIPNKDHVEDLKRCIQGLEQKAGKVQYEIIVIENNSTQQETFEYYKELEKNHKNCQVVFYQGGFNFSAINNFGRKFAKGEHLLLLNNDIEPLTDGFLEELVSYSQRCDVGAVGAKLFYPDDTLQHGGVFIGLGGSAGHSHKGHPRESVGSLYRLATTQNMSAVTGACLMVKTALYDQVDGLDEENFAVAYNDVDFCLKLRKKGYVNVFTPFAQAYHYESKSRGSDEHGENAKRYQGEKQRFVEKYADMMGEGGDPYYNPHLTLLYENYGYK